MSDETNAAVGRITSVSREEIEKLEATWQKRLDDANAFYDDHMKLPAPAGHVAATPPPVVPTLLLGASYGSGADKSKYNRRPQSARLFFENNLPDDIAADKMFKEAYGAGIRHYVLSWRGTQTASQVGGSLQTLPGDCTGLGTYFHEPEDNIKDGSLKLGDWKARNLRDADVMVDVGFTPVSILMAYTLASGSGRNVQDYAMNGKHVLMCFDMYMNPAKGKDNPEQVIDKAVAAALQSGAKGTGLCEAGVPSSVAQATAVDLIKRLRTKLIATKEARFGQYWSSKEFVFTDATANAWFEGK